MRDNGRYYFSPDTFKDQDCEKSLRAEKIIFEVKENDTGITAEDISDPDLFHQRLVIDSLKFDLFLQGFDTFIAHYRDVMLSFFFVIMC